MSKKKLESLIETVNRRYEAGLNDDDQVFRMFEEDKKTKGYTVRPGFDSYAIVTDKERLEELVRRHGYWGEEVKHFNEKLKIKGGYEYMREMNNKFL